MIKMPNPHQKNNSELKHLTIQSYQRKIEFKKIILNFAKKQQENYLLMNHLPKNINEFADDKNQENNTMLTIIILGDLGQLGTGFKEVLSDWERDDKNLFQIFGINRRQVDFTDWSNLVVILQQIIKPLAGQQKTLPFVIINTAAYTAVDKAESEQLQALAINQKLPENLAIFCQQHQGFLLHYSTDYVFDGELNSFLRNDFYSIQELENMSSVEQKIERYQEQSTPNPINFYGYSKYLGELAIKEHSQAYFIFRISWVFDTIHTNFLTTMLKLAERQQLAAEKNESFALKIIANQYGVPNLTYSIVDASLVAILDYMIKIIDKKLNPNTKIQNDCGIYHLSNSKLCSWFDYADFIFQSHQKNPAAQKITAKEYPTPAKRPYFSGLCAKKFELTFKYQFDDWQKGLQLALFNKSI